jgi:hypothetical protein
MAICEKLVEEVLKDLKKDPNTLPENSLATGSIVLKGRNPNARQDNFIKVKIKK